jgi:hypothetical protein
MLASFSFGSRASRTLHSRNRQRKPSIGGSLSTATTAPSKCSVGIPRLQPPLPASYKWGSLSCTHRTDFSGRGGPSLRSLKNKPRFWGENPPLFLFPAFSFTSERICCSFPPFSPQAPLSLPRAPDIPDFTMSNFGSNGNLREPVF